LPSAIANTKTGIGKIITKLKKCDDPHLVFEAAGGYEKLLLVMLQSADIKASRINPTLARNFAKAKGLLAKTDSIDARILTDYGIQFSPRETVPLDPILEEIQSLVKYRRHLNDELHRERMHLVHGVLMPASQESAYQGHMSASIRALEQVGSSSGCFPSAWLSVDPRARLLRRHHVGRGDGCRRLL
jgi:transposase